MRQAMSNMSMTMNALPIPCLLLCFVYVSTSPFGTGGRSIEISAFEGRWASNWVGEPHHWREAAGH